MHKARFSSWLVVLGSILAVLAVSVIEWHQAIALKALHRAHVQGTTALAQAQDALWRLRYGLPQFLVLDDNERKHIVADETK